MKRRARIIVDCAPPLPPGLVMARPAKGRWL